MILQFNSINSKITLLQQKSILDNKILYMKIKMPTLMDIRVRIVMITIIKWEIYFQVESKTKKFRKLIN